MALIRSRPPKLQHLFLLAMTLSFLLSGVILVYFVNHHMRQQALTEARSKALALLDHNLAIHTYFTHQLKPNLFKWTEPFRAEDYFDPAWMSSTYAVRQIYGYFAKLNREGLYYKEAAVNARSPESEADAHERDFLGRLAENQDLVVDAAIRTIGGKPYYVVMRRGEAMERSCLRCHGDPDNAPRDLVKQYGGKRSFGRTLETPVVQTISIRIPLAEAYAHANELSFNLSAILLLLLGLLFLLQFLMTRHLIFRPMAAIRSTAVGIAEGKNPPGTQIPLPFWHEWQDFTGAVNRMSAAVGETIGNLNRRVDERTADLQTLNRELQQEIMDREEAEEMFKKFFNANLNYCYIVSTKGIILEVNAAALQVLGYAREEVIGRSVEILYAPEYKERRREIFEEWKRSRLIDSEELVLMTRSGERRTVLLSASHISDAKGEILYSISVQTDITERKAAEEEIEQMDAQLRQAQKMESVGQLAGGVAHDFNNLLYVIMGYAEMTAAKVAGDEQLSSNIAAILSAGEQAANLVRQLLLFSRKEALQPKMLEMNELIGSLMKMMQRVIGEHIGLELRPGFELKKVHGDPGQLEQVLINLCVNARDAMPEGGRIVIETENDAVDADFCEDHPWARPGEYVRLTVSDTGCGMMPEVCEKVFEPFFTTKEVGKGTGLGLSAVYGIVKSHNGMIHVYSEPEHGSVFRIYLPAVAGAEDPDGTEMIHPPETAGNDGEGTILLVEDEEKVRKLANLVLTNAGYRVIQAADGEAAMEIIEARGEEIDLALLDVILPKAGGHLVYERIRETYPEMPVIFMTGYSRGLLPRIFADQAHEVLQKPFNRVRLLNRVRESLTRRG